MIKDGVNHKSRFDPIYTGGGVIAILLDQGLPRSTVTLLNNEGWDILHKGDIGLSRSSDKGRPYGAENWNQCSSGRVLCGAGTSYLQGKQFSVIREFNLET